MTEMDALVERVLDAPRPAVWRAFTEPEQLAAWFGPEGVVVPPESVSMDLRSGGGWSMRMHDDAGRRLHEGTARILQIEHESLLVTEERWAMAGLQPTTLRTRIELHDAGDDRTLLRIVQGPHGDMVGAAVASWEAGLARLEALLAG